MESEKLVEAMIREDGFESQELWLVLKEIGPRMDAAVAEMQGMTLEPKELLAVCTVLQTQSEIIDTQDQAIEKMAVVISRLRGAEDAQHPGN